jgi:diaminohydroxyphosphoribosylaminopyrimidine deaminase/5-amino-6-(5-phosphoribosylamino)uracil reductase
MTDPNPQVSGQGFEKLRAADVKVASGILIDEALTLNEAFAKYIRTHTPLITLKTAMTLDGKIAPPPAPGKNTEGATWITGEAARAHVQTLRHENDAILVGVGTVIADDPLLTDRSGLPRRRPLLRVILDSRLRLPLDSRLVKSAQNDVVVLCSFAEEKKKRQLQKHGIRVEQIGPPTPEGHPDPHATIRFLGGQEITSLLVEGGAMVNWAMLAAGVVDKVFLYYAPRILAGAKSVPFIEGAGFAHLADAPRVRNIRLHRFDDDFAVEGYLRDPYAD